MHGKARALAEGHSDGKSLGIARRHAERHDLAHDGRDARARSDGAGRHRSAHRSPDARGNGRSPRLRAKKSPKRARFGDFCIRSRPSDDLGEREREQHAADEQNNSEDVYPDAELAFLRGGGAVGRQEVGLPERHGDGLVDEERQRHVEPALDGVKRQEHRHEHLHDDGARRALPDGRHDVVPQEHHRDLHDDAYKQRHDRAVLVVHALVDERGRARERAGRQDVHQQADGAGRADGQHLDERDDDADAERRQRPEHEARHDDDRVLEVELERWLLDDGRHDKVADDHDDERYRGHHRHDRQLSGSEFLLLHSASSLPRARKNARTIMISGGGAAQNGEARLLPSRL